MTCNRFRTLIQQRFDQDLTTQDHRALINHLEGCESCAKFDHQLDQMIQAAQDTPAPDELRPQNPEAMARLVMEQLPQKKGSLVNMLMGLFGGGGGGKPKAAKAAPAPKGNSSAIKEKASKFKGKGKDKDNDRDLEPNRRPGGVTFGRKTNEQGSSEQIENQVGTFSRLKAMSSRTPEQLDRESQSTTRSLGEKFGMPGSSTILDEGPLTLAESIKRKVSESQKLSPLEDDPDASGSLVPIPDNAGSSIFSRPENAGGDGNWGPPAFSSQGQPAGQFAAPAGPPDKVDWGGSGHAARTSPGTVPAFSPSAPVGFDEHPGSSIGLAAPGSKRPMAVDQPAESSRAGIGLSPSADWGTSPAPGQTNAQSPVTEAPAAPAAWGATGPAPSTAGGAGGWGATDSLKTAAPDSNNWGGTPAPAAAAPAPAPAPAAPAASPSGWTSGWGGEGGQASVPLKSSDSWAVPGSDSTASWGQPSDSSAQAVSAPAPAAPQAASQAPPAPPTADPWAPPGGAWGGGQAAADAAQAASPQQSTGNSTWGAAANTAGSLPAADPWGAPAAAAPAQEMPAQPAAPPAPAPANAADPWGAAANASGAAPSHDPWGGAPAANTDNFVPAPAQPDAWGAAVSAAPEPAPAPTPLPPAQADVWGAAVAPPSAPAPSDAWGASSAPPASAAQADPWGAQPTVAAPAAPIAAPPAPIAAQADAWGATGALPAAPVAAPMDVPPVPIAAQADAWGASSAQVAAPVENAAWGSEPPAQNNNSAWGAQAAPEAMPAAAPAPALAAPPAASDPWGSAGAQPAWGEAAAVSSSPAAEPAAAEQWGAAPAPIPTPEPSNGMASGYATIPPGQFATPQNAGTAIASSGWGQAPVPPAPLDASQIEAKKSAWVAEAEQLETGTWKAFAPKMNEGLGGRPQALPAALPAPAPAPAAAAGERWDLPIQERAKTLGDQSAPGMANFSQGQAQPPAQVPVAATSPIAPIQPAPTSAQVRWDVPIQERAKLEPEPSVAPPVVSAPTMGMGTAMGMPPGSVGSPVMSSGIPVNQIVEKMGQVLGGQSQAASAEAQESRWDVPIQERAKTDQISQEMQASPAAAPAAPAAPVQQASNWGQPAFEAAPPVAAPTAAPVSESAAWGSNTNSWGQEPASVPVAAGWDAQPAVAPTNGGWGAGDSVSQPVAQPTSTWGQPAGTSWGEPAAQAPVSQQGPIVSQNQAPVSTAAWAGDTAGGAWSQPAAPMANSWADAQPQAASTPAPLPPPPQAPVIKPEVTDKVQGGGLLSGIDDKAIDRIFGEIGVQESVSKTLVNSGADPLSNFSPPQTPPAQQMAAPIAPSTQAAPAFAQASAAPAPAPQASRGLLGGIDDNAIDRIFSQNLGITEPAFPVGGAADMAAPNAAGSNNWSQSQPATPLAAPDPAQNSNWGTPPAATGWGQPPPNPQTSAPEAAPVASPGSGWGMPPATPPGQWGQPPAGAAPSFPMAGQPVAENGPPKLFSVDDSVMDRIFADNLGIPQDGQPAANAGNTAQPAAPMPAAAVFQNIPEIPAPAAQFQAGPPPKIEGIGRLDASMDANQDAGSGRIASIGKFLLDQKDLDKIGKLTNTDNNDNGKLRILTKENSDDLQALLGQIGAQKGVIGSVIVGHDGLLIANTMPPDMDAESVGVWALGVYMNTEHVTKKMGHDRVHQVVSRTPRGYVIIADFGGGLLVCVTEGKDTDSLIPLMRTITQLVN